MEQNGKPLIVQFGRELDLLLARLTTKGILFSAIVAITSVVQMIMGGVTHRHLFLLAGALLSGLAIFGFVVTVVRAADSGESRRSLLSMLLAFGGFVPYLFGTYLCFYEGFWKFFRLFDQFSVGVIVEAVFYVITGYLIVLAIYKASEFGRAVDEGRIQIRKAL